MRRARIKAVAALPVRRRNNEANEKAKAKEAAAKPAVDAALDLATTEPESPKTPVTKHTENDRITASENPKSCESITSDHVTLTPRRHRIQTPNLIERSRTPKSKKPGTPQRVSSPHLPRNSPLTRAISPNSQVINHAAAQIIDGLSANDKFKPSSVNLTSPLASVLKTREDRPNSPNSTAISQAKNEIVSSISNIQDYNPPSIPESVTEDTVLDGIVPLTNRTQQSSSVPLALLKNAIISENAEVLFDPIVPLPSPSKVRPKLRPVPRLAFRRNSVQGSASESEDESRRALLTGATTPAPPPRQRHDSHTSHSTQYTLPNREMSRVRNDSVCSVVSQAAAPGQAPPPTPSAHKEKHVSKVRRTEMSRRMSALRRRQRGRDNVPRDTLTMYDLIFYNPTANPIIPDEPDKPEERPTDSSEPEPTTGGAAEPEGGARGPEEGPAERGGESAPAPQIKLGPNGEIILDEKSLVIDQTEGPRKLSNLVVHENEWAHNNRGKYSRAPRTADWSDAETVRFYRALAALGTDFTLMEFLFPGRTRRDLKLKFKREERSNGAQVDKALRSQIKWDAVALRGEFASERQAAAEQAAAARQAEQEQKRAERARLRQARGEWRTLSKATKAMEFAAPRGGLLHPTKSTKNMPAQANTADQIITRALEARKKTKRKGKPDELPTLRPINHLPKHPIPTSPFATLTRQPSGHIPPPQRPPLTNIDMASISKIPTPNHTPACMSNVPQNIEQGSLVVLTVNDPNEPSKKMLQTYISHGSGALTPVALPPALLSSVMSYMKKGTPKGPVSSNSSPQFTSPSSVASQDSMGRSSVIQINPSPAKRQRHSSFTITQL